MKHIRFLALLTAVLLVFAPVAQATSHIAYFHQPEGSAMYALAEMGAAVAPQGLEDLYALFSQGNPEATVYVFRMPNGRALLSISCLETQASTTDALYEKRDTLAAGLQASLADVLAASPSFQMEEIYGQQALVASMSLQLESGTVDAQVAVFYRSGDLLEVWTACPSASRYLFDMEAAQELKSDLTALEELETSLDFSLPEDTEPAPADADDSLESVLDLINNKENTIAQPESAPYMTVTADDGLFSMKVPLDTVLVHAGSDEAAIARARKLFADIEGGEECFDLWMQDIQDVNGWLLISREYGVAAQVFVSEAGDFANMTASMLMQLEQPILQVMQESYDKAGVADDASTVEIDGKEHAWLTYDLYKGDMNLLTFVLATADETYLYELDVYTLINEDSHQEALIEIITMMLESLDYLPQIEL